ncbi:MAG: recombinase RecA [Rhodobacterales bacterium]|nr:recombinase RecA [Rhodobacterales bacterium]
MTKIDMKTRALNETLDQMEKRFGRGSVMRLGDATVADVEVISSGSLTLDGLLGIGGWPRGRVVEIYGPESSGKTTLTLHAIAEAQKTGTCAFIDAEHALDASYARALGVDTDDLIVAQPDHGEQALEIAESLVRSGAIDLLVIDSVAALVPRAEIEGDMGDHHVGLQARLMSQALRKITGITARTGCTVMFINQLRQKIGVTYGSNEVTTGGNALKFYSSIRVDIRRIGALKKGESIVGNKTKVRVVKNKMAPPFRTAEVEILYGRGICRVGEVMKLAEEGGLLSKSGSWYSWGDEKLGNGKEAVRANLLENPDLLSRLTACVVPSATPAAAK